MPIFIFIGHILSELLRKLTICKKIKIKHIGCFIYQMKFASKISCTGEKLLVVTFLYKPVKFHASTSNK